MCPYHFSCCYSLRYIQWKGGGGIQNHKILYFLMFARRCWRITENRRNFTFTFTKHFQCWSRGPISSNAVHNTRTDWLLGLRRVRNSAKKIIMSVSVRPSTWNNSAHNREIVTEFDIWVYLDNLSTRFKSHYNLTTITGTLHEDQYTFLIISRSTLLRMSNVSDKSCRENQKAFCVQ